MRSIEVEKRADIGEPANSHKSRSSEEHVARAMEAHWKDFASEVGIELASPPDLTGTYGKLDVLSAQWYAPEGDFEAVVELRIKTQAGRVLYLDMELPYDCILDGTNEYDVVDGELVEHPYDLSKPEEVARFFDGACDAAAGAKILGM